MVNLVTLNHHPLPACLSTCFASCHDDDDRFCLLFTAGELEKQQGAKTHSVKNNGTQLELRGKPGSPSGVCECVCIVAF